jgi:hypothetical protein
VDELFNESTAAPDFSSNQLSVDTTGFNSLVSLNFNSPEQSGWKTGDSLNYNISRDNNGRLRFISKVSMSYLVLLRIPTPVSIQSDFSYELTLNYPVGDATNQYGIIFGPVAAGSSGNGDPVEFMTINNNQNMYMGNRSWYSYFTELTKTSIIPTGNNKLKVFKIGQMLYYFINNAYCYCSEIVANSNLNEFGFMVPSLGTVWIDNFQISNRGVARVAPLSKKQLQFEFRTVPGDKFDLNKIKNQ